MKLIVTLVLVLFINTLYSQCVTAIFDFENNRIDSGKENDWLIIENSADNIWQIGAPQKSSFDKAKSNPNAIITDTVSPYPVNNHSSFVVKIPLTGNGGDPSSFNGFDFDFKHKFQTDKNNDGGYIEISYDYGFTWTNIVYDTLYCDRIEPCVGDKDCLEGYGFSNEYTNSDTIKGGIPAFSGSNLNWIDTGLHHFYNDNFICPDSLFFKFNFKSDDTQDNLDGWMIDDINFYITFGLVGLDEKTSNKQPVIFPNPITGNSILKLNNAASASSLIEILSINGEIIYSEKFNNEVFNIGALKLKKGLYFCSIINSGNSYSIKFIVQ